MEELLEIKSKKEDARAQLESLSAELQHQKQTLETYKARFSQSLQSQSNAPAASVTTERSPVAPVAPSNPTVTYPSSSLPNTTSVISKAISPISPNILYHLPDLINHEDRANAMRDQQWKTKPTILATKSYHPYVSSAGVNFGSSQSPRLRPIQAASQMGIMQENIIRQENNGPPNIMPRPINRMENIVPARVGPTSNSGFDQHLPPFAHPHAQHVAQQAQHVAQHVAQQAQQAVQVAHMSPGSIYIPHDSRLLSLLFFEWERLTCTRYKRIHVRTYKSG